MGRWPSTAVSPFSFRLLRERSRAIATQRDLAQSCPHSLQVNARETAKTDIAERSSFPIGPTSVADACDIVTSITWALIDDRQHFSQTIIYFAYNWVPRVHSLYTIITSPTQLAVALRLLVFMRCSSGTRDCARRSELRHGLQRPLSSHLRGSWTSRGAVQPPGPDVRAGMSR